MTKKNLDSYLIFLDAKNKILHTDLTPKEIILLDNIYCELSKFNGSNLNVKHIISKSNLGSPATLHKNLHNLVKANYIKLECYIVDMRVKHITLTNLSRRRLQQLENALCTAVLSKTLKKPKQP